METELIQLKILSVQIIQLTATCQKYFANRVVLVRPSELKDPKPVDQYEVGEVVEVTLTYRQKPFLVKGIYLPILIITLLIVNFYFTNNYFKRLHSKGEILSIANDEEKETNNKTQDKRPLSIASQVTIPRSRRVKIIEDDLNEDTDENDTEIQTQARNDRDCAMSVSGSACSTPAKSVREKSTPRKTPPTKTSQRTTYDENDTMPSSSKSSDNNKDQDRQQEATISKTALARGNSFGTRAIGEIKVYSEKEILGLALEKQTFAVVFSDQSKSFTPILHFFKWIRQYNDTKYNEIKDTKIAFKCIIANFETTRVCKFGDMTNLTKHIKNHSEKEIQTWYQAYCKTLKNYKETPLDTDTLKLVKLYVNLHMKLKSLYNPLFRSMMNVKLKSYNTFRCQVLPNVYNKLRDLLEKKLQTAASVCLITDIWTNNSMSDYIALIAFTMSANFDRQMMVLDMMRMPGAHNAENIKHAIESMINKFDFNKTKIKSVVCDQASALIRLFGQHNTDSWIDLEIEAAKKEDKQFIESQEFN